MVTASEDNTARVWDARTGQLLTEPLKHEKQVWSAQFSPDGQCVVTALEDNTARVWEAATGTEVHEALLDCRETDRMVAEEPERVTPWFSMEWQRLRSEYRELIESLGGRDLTDRA